MRTVRYAVVVAGLAIVALTGCGRNAADMQIAQLQDKVAELEQQRAELRNRLAAAIDDADNYRSRALELQAQLDRARADISSLELKGQSNLPEGWQGTDKIAWIDLADDILFPSGRAKLTAQGEKTVKAVADTIKRDFTGREIWVIGHTDNDPIKVTKNLWDDNLDLSLARGAAVTRELYKLGLDPQSIVAAGQGDHAPKAPNDTKANKAKNRRVQVVAVERPQQIPDLDVDAGASLQ